MYSSDYQMQKKTKTNQNQKTPSGFKKEIVQNAGKKQ